MIEVLQQFDFANHSKTVTRVLKRVSNLFDGDYPATAWIVGGAAHDAHKREIRKWRARVSVRGGIHNNSVGARAERFDVGKSSVNRECWVHVWRLKRMLLGEYAFAFTQWWRRHFWNADRKRERCTGRGLLRYEERRIINQTKHTGTGEMKKDIGGNNCDNWAVKRFHWWKPNESQGMIAKYLMDKLVH